jgi:hypothetical protein
MLKFMINPTLKGGINLGILSKKFKFKGISRKRGRRRIFGQKLRGCCVVGVGIMWRSWRNCRLMRRV